MGTKRAVSLANIFMAKIETTLIQQNETKPFEWRRYIDDIFSLWDSDKKDVDKFIEQANKFHPIIKFTAEKSENAITLLDTVVFEGERLKKKRIHCGHQTSLQTYRNFSIYTFHLMPSTRREKCFQ